jgi:hypothetical protein
MKMTYDLPSLSKELRDLPRHLWDEHLMGFCEALLMEHSGLERARIPAEVERPTAEFARRTQQCSRG